MQTGFVGPVFGGGIGAKNDVGADGDSQGTVAAFSGAPKKLGIFCRTRFLWAIIQPRPHNHMSLHFDHPESTWVYDYPAQTAELYTTDRRLWLRAIARNPNFISVTDLQPGYTIVYPLKQVRNADMVVSPKTGGIEAAKQYMTPQEIEFRDTTGRRLRAAQSQNQQP